MLALLQEEGALFLIVGAHALAVHGYVRATGDLDIWIRPDPGNAERVWRALVRFGAPVEAMGVTTNDLSRPGIVYQIGLPPRRIDILTEISGVGFDDGLRKSSVVRRIESMRKLAAGSRSDAAPTCSPALPEDRRNGARS